MNFADVCALSLPALHLAIEEHCYGRLWKVVTRLSTINPARQMYEPTGIWIVRDAPRHPYDGPWGLGRMPYAHTESWDMCMPLAWRYRLEVRPPQMIGEGASVLAPTMGIYEDIVTETDARVAVCRLALWEALQREEEPHA